MEIAFYKYHGAGNDFIILDNRTLKFDLNANQIAQLCHRRTGIGSDGLIILQNSYKADFEMVYFNADGRLASFCGNGGRCIADFAYRKLNITGKKMQFSATDGIHGATIISNNEVRLQMNGVQSIIFNKNHQILNTGSPHYVKWVEALAAYPVFEEGKKIRCEAQFEPNGINVNFAEKINDLINVRTYERGVEQETLACGTGVTATAIASVGEATGHYSIKLKTQNNDLFQVAFQKLTKNTADKITLTGPVCFAFEGKIDLHR